MVPGGRVVGERDEAPLVKKKMLASAKKLLLEFRQRKKNAASRVEVTTPRSDDPDSLKPVDSIR